MISFFYYLFLLLTINMSKAVVEALAMRVDALEKEKVSSSMRIQALEKDMAAKFALPLNTPNALVKDKKPKKEKKPKPLDADGKPKKKRTTGYILFCNSKRDDVKTQLSTGPDKPKNTDVMVQLASLWRDLSDSHKNEWNAKAKLPISNDDDDDDDDDLVHDNDDDE